MGIRPYGQRPQNPEVLRASYLAKRLRVEPETVKAHLARMEASKFIRFYPTYPNFRHLGITSAAYLFRVPDDDQKAAAIERVQAIDGLVEVHNFLGAEMCVEVTCRADHDLNKKLRLLAEFTGDANPSRFYDRDLPPRPPAAHAPGLADREGVAISGPPAAGGRGERARGERTDGPAAIRSDDGRGQHVHRAGGGPEQGPRNNPLRAPLLHDAAGRRLDPPACPPDVRGSVPVPLHPRVGRPRELRCAPRRGRYGGDRDDAPAGSPHPRHRKGVGAHVSELVRVHGLDRRGDR